MANFANLLTPMRTPKLKVMQKLLLRLLSLILILSLACLGNGGQSRLGSGKHNQLQQYEGELGVRGQGQGKS